MALNHALSAHPAFANLYDVLSNNDFVRGLPIIAALAFLWFSRDARGQLHLIVQLLAISAATVTSVLVQRLHLFHTRPMLRPELGLHLPADLAGQLWNDAPWSWPSDTATLYAGLVAIVCRDKPRLGVALGVWTLVVILIPRVAFGYHYASDVASGVVLGASAVLIADALFKAGEQPLVDRLSAPVGHHPVLINTLFMIGVWQLADLMIDPRAAIHAVALFMRH